MSPSLPLSAKGLPCARKQQQQRPSTAVTDRLQVLYRQESTIYAAEDYLRPPAAKRSVHNHNAPELLSTNNSTRAAEPSRRKAGKPRTVNRKWREMIVEWAYQVVDHFEMNRDIVAVTMNYLDRYTVLSLREMEANDAKNEAIVIARGDGGTSPSSTSSSYSSSSTARPTPVIMNSRRYQLVAMTCLYISIKLYEYRRLLVVPGCSDSTVETMLHMSSGRFTLEQLREAERDVLMKLDWRLTPPTAQLFVKMFIFQEEPSPSLPSSSLPSSPQSTSSPPSSSTSPSSSSEPGSSLSSEEKERRRDILDSALYQTELSVLDPAFVTTRPSVIARAAVRNAVKLVSAERAAAAAAAAVGSADASDVDGGIDTGIGTDLDIDIDIDVDEDLGWCCDRLRVLLSKVCVETSRDVGSGLGIGASRADTSSPVGVMDDLTCID